MKSLIYLSGGPGDTRAAAKPLATFLAQWEQAAQLPVGSIQGEYYPGKEGALRYASEAKPVLFLLPAVTFFEFEKTWNLKALAQVAVGDSAQESLHVVAKKGTTLASLKGKSMASNLTEDPRFLALIKFSDGTKFEGFFAHVTYERSPLASLRQLRDGTVSGVLLDETQWKSIDKLPFAAELEGLATTQPVPRPVLAVSQTVPAEVQAKLKKGALALAQSPEAKKSLQQFSVDSIVSADTALIDRVRPVSATPKKTKKSK